jgi:TRAP-type mannitol/chloroaromatic compound transport system permease small subunit
LWPIKLVMTVAIFLMLLQAVATFFKDVAEVRGKPIA